MQSQPVLISQEEAQSTIGPLHQHLATAVRQSFLEWQEIVAPLVPRFRPRTQADVMQDAIEPKLRTLLGANEGVVFSPPTSDRFWIRFRGVLVRFKKINGAGTTSNYRTETANKFDGQLQLPAFPEGARLTVAYELNRDGKELVAVWVALFRGQTRMWRYELVADSAGIVSIGASAAKELPGADLKLKSGVKKKSNAK